LSLYVTIQLYLLRVDTLEVSLENYCKVQDGIEDLDLDGLDTENRSEMVDKCYALIADFNSEIQSTFSLYKAKRKASCHFNSHFL